MIIFQIQAQMKIIAINKMNKIKIKIKINLHQIVIVKLKNRKIFNKIVFHNFLLKLAQ